MAYDIRQCSNRGKHFETHPLTHSKRTLNPLIPVDYRCAFPHFRRMPTLTLIKHCVDTLIPDKVPR